MLKVLRPVRCALAVVRRSQRAYSGSTYPAHDVVGMPALSPTMEVGTIVNWTKEEGDEVTAGETIAEIETDKATINFDAVDDAFLAKILVPAGSEVPVGTPIMVTVEERESVKKFSSYSVSTDSQISQGSVEEERPIAGVKKNETEATSNPNFKEEREARPPSASNETASPSGQEENDSKSLPSAVPDKISENKSYGEFSMWGSSVRKSALAKAISQEQQAFVREFGSSLHSPI